MIDIIRQILGLPADYGNYYSTCVNIAGVVIIVLTVLFSLGIYRLWKYITKF